jgi:hypothetical protein
MIINISKTRVMSHSRKTNVLSYEYQLCHTAVTRTSSIKDVGVFFDCKLYFHSHVDFMFSECIKLLGLIRSITFRFSFLDCLYVLHFTLVRSKSEYVSVVWNSVTSIDANKLERIQQKFASVCFYSLFPHVPYSYRYALEKLSLHSLRARRDHLNEFFFFFVLAYRSLKSCTSLLENDSLRVPQINTVLLLGAPMLPTWCVNLQSERFLCIIFYNLVLKVC